MRFLCLLIITVTMAAIVIPIATQATKQHAQYTQSVSSHWLNFFHLQQYARMLNEHSAAVGQVYQRVGGKLL